MVYLSTKQQTTAHVNVKIYVTSAGMYVTSAGMYVTSAGMCVTSAGMSMDVHRRGKQEGNLARYLNWRIYKFYVISYNFVDGDWDTAVTNIATAPGHVRKSIRATSVFPH